MKKPILIFCLAGLFVACTHEPSAQWISTTADSLFVEKTNLKVTADTNTAADITVLLDKPQQTLDGFGGCF
ncbi:MAG: beta-glycosidase, partial [Prevotella sp.]|nr:beta-glycosidase [Prevotella sp.]